ncbi:MAG TPA: hypothetical protein ENK44_13585 [Caldithrix abyssi]|uniref:Transcriptional initiation protein Tat n=1 Tax=Caldithrix abyssi TaxID=187145 RepID=A0A7V4WWM4_CALAY|nr:hypothetical protein [Caldithrix abyssi]
MKQVYVLLLIIILTSCSNQQVGEANRFYPVNKPPLKQTALVKLPLGAVKPAGWLKDQLIVQSKGLTGHLDEFWPDIKNSAWKGGDGEAWERGPYYLDGLIPLAYLLDDENLKKKAETFVRWIIRSSKEDGWFGPDKNNDRWPLAVASKDLMQYYEATGNEQVLDVLKKYFHYLATHPPDWPDSTWRGVRAMENAVTGYWLYRQTGEREILQVIESIQKNSYDWTKYYYEFPWDSQAVAEHKLPLNWKADGLTAHVVNNAMAVKYPGLWYQQSKDECFRQAVYEALAKYDKNHGQVGGRFSGDEHLHGRSPVQGTELCSVVEYMFSLEQLLEVLGDPALADRLETLAYNALPATVTPDYWAHQYDQQANQVLVTLDERDWSTNGPESNLYGLMPNYPCCLANMHQGWPKFVQSLWMATHDNGLAAVTLGPSVVTAKVGDGATVTIKEETEYPFDGKIRFKIETDKAVAFPLYVRIPDWAKDVKITIGDETVPAKAGQFVKLERKWQNGNAVEILLPMKLRSEKRYRGAVSILRGPLYFALRIGKKYNKIKIKSRNTYSIDYMGSVDWEIRPTSAWNYGLVIDPDRLEKNLRIRRNPIRSLPFADAGEMVYDEEKNKYVKWPYEAPVVIEAPAVELNGWNIVRNSAGEVPQSPIEADGKRTMVTLVPYGSTRLRISEFPYIK